MSCNSNNIGEKDEMTKVKARLSMEGKIAHQKENESLRIRSEDILRLTQVDNDAEAGLNSDDDSSFGRHSNSVIRGGTIPKGRKTKKKSNRNTMTSSKSHTSTKKTEKVGKSTNSKAQSTSTAGPTAKVARRDISAFDARATPTSQLSNPTTTVYTSISTDTSFTDSHESPQIVSSVENNSHVQHSAVLARYPGAERVLGRDSIHSVDDTDDNYDDNYDDEADDLESQGIVTPSLDVKHDSSPGLDEEKGTVTAVAIARDDLEEEIRQRLMAETLTAEVVVGELVDPNDVELGGKNDANLESTDLDRQSERKVRFYLVVAIVATVVAITQNNKKGPDVPNTNPVPLPGTPDPFLVPTRQVTTPPREGNN